MTILAGPMVDVRIGSPGAPAEGPMGYYFGSAHTAAMHGVFADGRVQPIAYGIDRVTFNAMGNRKDGLTITIE